MPLSLYLFCTLLDDTPVYTYCTLQLTTVYDTPESIPIPFPTIQCPGLYLFRTLLDVAPVFTYSTPYYTTPLSLYLLHTILDNAPQSLPTLHPTRPDTSLHAYSTPYYCRRYISIFIYSTPPLVPGVLSHIFM